MGYWQELAEGEHAEKQGEHDRTGEHVWLDVTTFRDLPMRRFMCEFCSATKEEHSGEDPLENCRAEELDSVLEGIAEELRENYGKRAR